MIFFLNSFFTQWLYRGSNWTNSTKYECIISTAAGAWSPLLWAKLQAMFCFVLFSGGRSSRESSDHLSGDLLKAATTGRFSGTVRGGGGGGGWLHMYCIIN